MRTTDGMATEFARIPDGTFEMGANDGPHPEDGEGPGRRVTLSAFAIRKTTVTNAHFAEFIEATGYVTVAQQRGASLVFQGQLATPDRFAVASLAAPWWRDVPGADWRTPNAVDRAGDDLPVVHIAVADALAFCDWAGTRLASEAEWERAAQGTQLDGTHIWRGRFPDQPLTVPGPVLAATGDPNPAGLFHMCGNVWEWTADRFTNLHSPRDVTNPKGPLNGRDRVVKGGSFLCCPSYCARYRPTSRRAEATGVTTSHLGFRDVIA